MFLHESIKNGIIEGGKPELGDIKAIVQVTTVSRTPVSDGKRWENYYYGSTASVRSDDPWFKLTESERDQWPLSGGILEASIVRLGNCQEVDHPLDIYVTVYVGSR